MDRLNEDENGATVFDIEEMRKRSCRRGLSRRKKWRCG